MVNKYYDKKGFTVIEMAAVISIIILLTGTIIASVNYQRKKARDAVRTHDIQKLKEAIFLYYDEHGYYPTGEDDTIGGQGVDWDSYKNKTALKDDESSFIPELAEEGYIQRSFRDPKILKNVGGSPIGMYRYWFENSDIGNIQQRETGCGKNPEAKAMLEFRFETGQSEKYNKLGANANAVCFY